MISDYGSWILVLLAILTTYLLTSKRVSGWYWTLATQCLWAVYGIITEQYAFIFSSLVFGALAVRGIVCWTRDARVESRSE